MDVRLNYGLTLIELMVALTIIVTATILAVPYIQSFFSKNLSINHISTLLTDINVSRTEAIKRNNKIILCQSSNGIHCSRTRQWHSGWIIFSDTNDNNKRDNDETIIKVRSPLKGSIRLQYSGFRTDHFVSFHPTGITTNNGTFTLCSEKSEYNRAVIIARTGRVRLSDTMPNGNPVSCNNYS